MMVLLSFLIAAALGFFFISWLWPNESESFSEIPIKFCLGLGVGPGLTSCLLFLWLVFYGQADRKYLLLEGIVTAALAVAYILKRRRSPVSTSANHSIWKYQWLLLAVFVLAVCAGIYAAIFAINRQPHGNGWDAWAIYGVRARAIFRGGAAWRDTFSTLISWSHPDYPLLLPLSTVRIWLYSGGEVKAVQSFLTVTYAVATVGVVTFGLKRVRGFEQGLLAGILVLGWTTFLTYMGSAYADTPVMFFFTATLVLFALYHATTNGTSNYLVLAGVTAGLAAWTKNEGLLFVVACAAAHLVVILRTQGAKVYFRQLRLFAYGLVPLLAIVFYFKTQLAPPSELVTAMSNQSTAAKLLDFRRAIYILRSFYWELIYYTGRGISLTYLLPLYLLCFGVTLKHKLTILQLGLTVLLMFAGYFWVYLTTPYDVAFHIKFSIDRLMMQQWPAFVFLFFLIAMSPNESLPRINAEGVG